MRKLKINGIYRHFKGDYYLVIDVGTHFEMLLSEVDHEKYPNVTQKYRMELQDIESVKANLKK